MGVGAATNTTVVQSHSTPFRRIMPLTMSKVRTLSHGVAMVGGGDRLTGTERQLLNRQQTTSRLSAVPSSGVTNLAICLQLTSVTVAVRIVVLVGALGFTCKRQRCAIRGLLGLRNRGRSSGKNIIQSAASKCRRSPLDTSQSYLVRARQLSHAPAQWR